MTTQAALPQRILVGVSLSDDPFADDFRVVVGDKALINQARWYAQKTGAEITFFHCIEGLDARLMGMEKSVHDVVRDKVEPFLTKLVDESKAMQVNASYRIEDGLASEKLLQTASKDDFDMVMVCFHRDESALDRFFNGSTSKRLLRYCPKPVWVVSPNHTTPNLDRLLVSADFSSTTEGCVKLANQLAETFGVERYLVHALEYPGALAAAHMVGGESALQTYRKGVRNEANTKINTLLGDKRKDWHVFLVEHPIADQLKLFCDQKDINLVVMGTVARTGLAGFFMGNTAERIIEALETPVLAIKPEGWVPPT